MLIGLSLISFRITSKPRFDVCWSRVHGFADRGKRLALPAHATPGITDRLNKRGQFSDEFFCVAPMKSLHLILSIWHMRARAFLGHLLDCVAKAFCAFVGLG